MNKQATQSFFDMMSRNQFVILDTETTGLYHGSEIVQIAILDFMGDILLDTLVQPKNVIPVDAMNIHGITNEMVKGQPTWPDIRETVYELIKSRDVIVYNADYDLSMLQSCDYVYGMNDIGWQNITRWHCAMKMYAEFWGDWNDYRQSYRWQKLVAACRQQKVNVEDLHSALGDCKATFSLLTKMRSDAAREEIMKTVDTDPICQHTYYYMTDDGKYICETCGSNLDREM